MKCNGKYALFFGAIFFAHFSFAGCGQSDMNKAVKQLMSEARKVYKIPGLQLSRCAPWKAEGRGV